MQIIEGCQSPELRNRLLEKEKMTLNQVERLAKTLESVSQQYSAMSAATSVPPSSANSTSVCHTPAHPKFPRKKGKKGAEKPAFTSKPQAASAAGKIVCFCCGIEGHRPRESNCPARNATCGKCKKTGHFAKVCNSRTGQGEKNKVPEPKPASTAVKAVYDESVFCICTSSNADSSKEELITCQIGGVTDQMFIDLGAKFSMISNNSWKKLVGKGIRFLSFVPNPDLNFFDASGRFQYTVLRTAKVEIECSGNLIVAELVIVREGIQTLLGSNDAKALGVLRVGVNAVTELCVKSVPTSSNSALSKLKNFQLSIPIDRSVTPVIQPFRRIPFGLRVRVEEQLDELLRLDIIERVNGASSWVSPIVPVPKGPNGIRLCVDMRRVNEAVLNEKHPIPTIEDVAPLLKDATVFSKIDLQQAYYQIEIAPESRELTTFATHVGLFRYKRLVQGLKCAPEMFQRILENVLAGLSGVFNYLDDLLVFGSSVEEHDANLKAVLHPLNEVGLVLNSSKCQFRQNEVPFLGHVIGNNSIRPAFDKVHAVKEFRAPQTAEEQKFHWFSFLLGKIYSAFFD